MKKEQLKITMTCDKCNLEYDSKCPDVIGCPECGSLSGSYQPNENDCTLCANFKFNSTAYPSGRCQYGVTALGFTCSDFKKK